jgi:hypothetical protein
MSSSSLAVLSPLPQSPSATCSSLVTCISLVACPPPWSLVSPWGHLSSTLVPPSPLVTSSHLVTYPALATCPLLITYPPWPPASMFTCLSSVVLVLSRPLLLCLFGEYWFRLSHNVYDRNRSFAPILSQSRWSLLV